MATLQSLADLNRSNVESPENAVPYAELHAHSTYSFLDGASGPEALLEEAARLGLHSLALSRRKDSRTWNWKARGKGFWKPILT